MDRDADNDGILDLRESQGNGCYITPVGTVDVRGVPSNFTSYPNCGDHSTATTYGIIPHIDSDDSADTAPDYLDLDTDGDSAADYSEGFDFNSTLTTTSEDYLVILATYTANNGGNPGPYTSTNTDGDTFPDWLDNLPGSVGHNYAVLPPFQTPGSPFYLDTDGDGIVDLLDADNGGVAQTNTRPDWDSDGNYDWRDRNTFVPLPVTLISFTAQKAPGHQAIISWSTTDELELSHFVVERSYNGVTWQSAGNLPSEGNSIGIRTYSLPDVSIDPSQNRVYYRLVSVNNSGTKEYSSVKTVVFDLGSQAVRLHPNPTSGKVQVEMHETETPVAYTLMDVRGKTILSGYLNDKRTLDLSGVTKGMYFLKLNADGVEMKTEKILVQ